MENKFKLQLPNKDGELEEVSTNQSLFLIGANGSGKTRLGSWIDLQSPQKERVHRISAQKSLAMPDYILPAPIDKAKKELLYGKSNINEDNRLYYKERERWNNHPAVSLLNDFQKLMVYLFSDYTEESSKYLQKSKEVEKRVEPPITKLDKVKEVWERILPHRELILESLKIETCINGQRNKPYKSSEMSDGERVIFYLLGQCLAAPINGIIIVDEPEIHLHKSIQIPLWMEIQCLRPDCLFVYMTHDIDFAVTFPESEKIWLKSYDGSDWDWEYVPDVQGLPEPLLIEILGTRKPVVFVEGNNGSYDVSLYRAILNDFLVVPCGSCTQVIQNVKALRNSKKLHHLEVYGLIDRDRRVDFEIQSLVENKIYTLEVAEVENLFCVPEIISIVSTHIFRDADADKRSVMNFIIKKMKAELETQISMRTVSEIKFKLNCFDENAKGKIEIKEALKSLSSCINVERLYDENQSIFNEAVENKDYLRLLKLYNRKSLAKQISRHLGFSHDEFAELVIRIAKSDKGNTVKQALKPYLGKFAEKIS